MLIFFSLLQGLLNLRSQARENIIIGLGIVLGTLPLIHQRDVDKRHQANGMIALASLISLGIRVVAICYQLSGSTVIDFVLAVHSDLDFLVIDVQSYM